MFVQSARSGTFDGSTLTLDSVGSTLYFSDRPARLEGHVKTGKFVGEVSFLSGDISTAMVVATEPVRCLAWKKEPLERLLARQPDLVNVFYAAVGKDLAAKVAHHNVALSQV